MPYIYICTSLFCTSTQFACFIFSTALVNTEECIILLMPYIMKSSVLYKLCKCVHQIYILVCEAPHILLVVIFCEHMQNDVHLNTVYTVVLGFNRQVQDPGCCHGLV